MNRGHTMTDNQWDGSGLVRRDREQLLRRVALILLKVFHVATQTPAVKWFNLIPETTSFSSSVSGANEGADS